MLQVLLNKQFCYSRYCAYNAWRSKRLKVILWRIVRTGADEWMGLKQIEGRKRFIQNVPALKFLYQTLPIIFGIQKIMQKIVLHQRVHAVSRVAGTELWQVHSITAKTTNALSLLLCQFIILRCVISSFMRDHNKQTPSWQKAGIFSQTQTRIFYKSMYSFGDKL